MINIEKRVYEEIFRYHEFRRSSGGGWLNSTETLAGTPTVTVKEKFTDIDRSSEMISNVAIYNHTQVVYKLFGGTANTLYEITIRVTTSNAQKFEDHLELKVL